MTESYSHGRHAKNSATQSIGNLPRTDVSSDSVVGHTSLAGSSSSSYSNDYSGYQVYHAGGDDIDNYRAEKYRGSKRTSGGLVAKRILLSVLGVIAVCAVVLGVSGFFMYRSVDGVRDDASRLKSQIVLGDYTSAISSADALAQRAKDLNNQASNPLWAAASVLPFVGNDVKALRAICSSADDLCAAVLVPMVSNLAVSGVGPVVGSEKNIDADAVQVMIDSIGGASNSIYRHNYAVQQLDACTIGQLDSVRKQLRGILGALDTVSTVAPQLSSRIHWLLGAEGEPRSYLLVAQNNVEIRATGGYPGSLGPLYVENGKMEMGDFVAVTSFGRFDDYRPNKQIFVDPLDITEEEKTIFGTRIRLVPGDANFNPSFPWAAKMWEYTWEVTGSGNVDGVIAIDPILLQDLLSLFGSVTASDGTVVDGDNAARLLMHDTYWSRSANDQDAFFAEVAGLAFDNLFGNFSSVDLVGLTQLLWHAGKDGHLLVFFDDANAQYAFSHIGYSGELGHDASNPTLGVYFNDDTWSKMFWYFSADTSIGKAAENSDGSFSYQVTTTVRNNIPDEEAQALPDYVAGGSYRCRSRTDMVLWIYLIAPEGGTISNVVADGTFSDPARLKLPYYGEALNQGMNEASYEGLDVWYCMPQMDKGEETVITYTVTTAPVSSGDAPQARLRLNATPTAQEIAGW